MLRRQREQGESFRRCVLSLDGGLKMVVGKVGCGSLCPHWAGKSGGMLDKKESPPTEFS